MTALDAILPHHALFHQAAAASVQKDTPALEPIESLGSLQSLQDSIAAWQTRTFPGQPLDGKLAHLGREVAELRAAPGDATEWADVFILLLGSAAMAGLSVSDLLAAATIKFNIAKNRQWGPADAEGVHHHLEGT